MVVGVNMFTCNRVNHFVEIMHDNAQLASFSGPPSVCQRELAALAASGNMKWSISGSLAIISGSGKVSKKAATFVGPTSAFRRLLEAKFEGAG